jgi:hypothetical protein
MGRRKCMDVCVFTQLLVVYVRICRHVNATVATCFGMGAHCLGMDAEAGAEVGGS